MRHLHPCLLPKMSPDLKQSNSKFPGQVSAEGWFLSRKVFSETDDPFPYE